MAEGVILNVQTEGANFGTVPSIFRQKSYTLFFSKNNFTVFFEK